MIIITKPQVTDAFELSLQKRKGATFYSLTGFFRDSRDGVTDIFTDLGGGHHVGGGSHGSLSVDDSEVPFLRVGVDGDAGSIADVAPLVLAHFGVRAPAYALDRAA